MGRYIYELINQKKDLQRKIDNYCLMVDKNVGKKDYFKLKDENFDKVSKLQKKLRELNKKIDFLMTLRVKIDRNR